MSFEATIKKWGNSYAIIVPKEFAVARHLQENERIFVTVAKPFDQEAFFKKVKPLKMKMTTQQLKDMARAGWG